MVRGSRQDAGLKRYFSRAASRRNMARLSKEVLQGSSINIEQFLLKSIKKFQKRLSSCFVAPLKNKVAEMEIWKYTDTEMKTAFFVFKCISSYLISLLRAVFIVSDGFTLTSEYFLMLMAYIVYHAPNPNSNSNFKILRLRKMDRSFPLHHLVRSEEQEKQQQQQPRLCLCSSFVG